MVQFKESSPRLWVDLDAIKHNYRCIATYARPATASAVVKANAYGMVDLPIVKSLIQEGCQSFFVANLFEAMKLRESLASASIQDEITISTFHGIELDYESHYVHSKITPVLNTPDDIDVWCAAAQKYKKKLPAILKINTGMNRLGLSEDHLKRLDYGAINKHLNIQLVMSHLAHGNIPHNPHNKKQLDLFISLTDRYFMDSPRSIAASNILGLPHEYGLNAVRLGLCIYGYSKTILPEGQVLKPALKLQARIIQRHTLDAGEAVGYEGEFVAKDRMVVGTIGIGYADGLPLSVSNKNATVQIGAYTSPIIGQISMDMAAIDLTNIPIEACHRNTWVDLFHDNMSLYELAKIAGSSMHELLTRLGVRCNRVYAE